MSTTFAVAAATTLLLASGCSQGSASQGPSGASADQKPLIFSAVPNQQAAALQQSFQPILNMLEKETGRQIRFVSATSYDAVIEGLRAGRIQIAALGPFSYVLAKDQGVQITAVAAQVTKKGAPPGYKSYGITRAGSTIKSLKDFRGKKVCFVDRASTSGYLYPSAGLLAAGINPLRDTMPIFAGSHEASVLAVASGKCDAGFAYDTMVDRQLIERREIKPGQIVTVWKSPIIPGAPIVIASNLPSVLRQELTEALQHKANATYLRANGFCQGRCGIIGGDGYGYVATTDSFYNGARQVCRIIHDKSCTKG
jgi:phosphonate transport system substrate-binding protein